MFYESWQDFDKNHTVIIPRLLWQDLRYKIRYESYYTILAWNLQNSCEDLMHESPSSLARSMHSSLHDVHESCQDFDKNHRVIMPRYHGKIFANLCFKIRHES